MRGAVEIKECVSAEEIWFERLLTKNKVDFLKKVLADPDNQPGGPYYMPDQAEEERRLIRLYESISDEELSKLVLWKRENKRRYEGFFDEAEKAGAEKAARNSMFQNRELFSYDELHPDFIVKNEKTGATATIEPFCDAKTVQKMASLTSMDAARLAIMKIRGEGFSVFANNGRVILFDEVQFYEFTNHRRISDKGLHGKDFKKFISLGFRVTGRMKNFAKREASVVSEEERKKKVLLASETTCENFQEKLSLLPDKSAVAAAQKALVAMRSSEEAKFNEIVRSQGFKGPAELASWLEDVRSGKSKFEIKAGPEKSKSAPEFGLGL